MKLRAIAAVLSTVALLTACGGGGDDDDAFPDPVAAAAAWQNLYNSSNRQWSLTGTGSDNVAYSMSLQLVQGGTQVFPLTGVSTTARHWDSTLTAAGQLPVSGRGTYYLDPASLALVGTQVGDVCAQATGSVLPPASTAVGTSGIQAQLTGYLGCNLSLPTGVTGPMRWAVAQAAGVVYLCTTVTQADSNGNSYFEEDCFETTPQGQIGSRARVYIQTKTSTTTWSLRLTTP